MFDDVRTGKVDIVAKTKEVIARCKEINEEYHYFTVITEELALQQAEEVAKNPSGKLAGLFISVKDCICIKDIATQSASRILEGYQPVFDATVVERLVAEGAIIIGKTVQDEFGFGTFSTNVGLGFTVPLNPVDKERATGGSSGGSGGVSAVADFAHVSIGESTGGSIVCPASLCGVYGLCPTYGRVSRYGLMDYGNSLDKIGPMGNDIDAVSAVLSVISGKDEKDGTSLDAPVPDYSTAGDGEKLVVGVIKEGFGEGLQPEVKEAIESGIALLKSKGVEVKEISLPTTFEHGITAYYLLAQSESSTNLAKYCGMRYGKSEALEGNFNEYFSKVRSAHFGKEAKRRVMLGTFARMIGVRDAYYIKALKVRTKIINEYKKAFEECDVLLSPTVPFVAPKFEEIKKMSPLEEYLADQLTVGPNIAGLPHLSIPLSVGEGKLPIGLLATADHLQEEKLIALAKVIA